MKTNHNETIVRENQDILTYIVDVQTEQADAAADYEHDTFRSRMTGISRNIEDNKRKTMKDSKQIYSSLRTIFQNINLAQHKMTTGVYSQVQR